MKLMKFLDDRNISYKSAAENMGLHYSNIYPLLDSKVFNNEALAKAIDSQVTSMPGDYKMVRTTVGKDGSVNIKISLLPVEDMYCKNKSVLDWIEDLAGKCSAGEIALTSGYKLSSIHETASRAGISLKVK